MRIAMTKPLFAWDELEDSPTLSTVRELLESLPEGKLLTSLRSARGKGRDDYPVHVLWGVVGTCRGSWLSWAQNLIVSI